MSRSLFTSAVSLIKSRLSDKRECRYGDYTLSRKDDQRWQKENTDPEVRDHYIERNPVLQNQDYGCRWQRVEFVCRNL